MRRAAVLLLLLAACASSRQPESADLLTCTTLNAASVGGVQRWERDEVIDYARHADDSQLRAASTITAVAKACDDLGL